MSAPSRRPRIIRRNFQPLTPERAVIDLTQMASPLAPPPSKKRKCPFLEYEAEDSDDELDSDVSTDGSQETLPNFIVSGSEDDMPPFHPILLRSPAHVRPPQVQEQEEEEDNEQHVPVRHEVDLTGDSDHDDADAAEAAAVERVSKTIRSDDTTRHHAWLITINCANPVQRAGVLVRVAPELATLATSVRAEWACGQWERKAIDHNHFVLYFKNAITYTSFKGRLETWNKSAKPNIRVCFNVAGAIKYVTKETSRIQGPWYYPDMPSVLKHVSESGKGGQGRRSELTAFSNAIVEAVNTGGDLEDVMIAHGNQTMKYYKGAMHLAALVNKKKVQQEYSAVGRVRPEVTVLYGPTGTGKTKYVDDTCCLMAPDVYVVTMEKWFDGLLPQHTTVVLDDFSWPFAYAFFLRMLDGIPQNHEVKGASMFTCIERVS